MQAISHVSSERRVNRRRTCRIPVRVRVAGEGWSDSFLLDARDVGEGGVFLRSDLLFSLGQQLELELATSSRSQPIRRSGSVVRVVGRSLRSDPGFVVGMFGLSDDERAELGLI